MTNILFSAAAVLFAIIAGFMLPGIAGSKPLGSLKPSGRASAKKLIPLMAVFVILIVLAGLNAKFKYM